MEDLRLQTTSVEDRFQQLARLHAVSVGINAATVRIRSIQELYDAACRIAVEKGGLLLAWVGLAEPGSDCLRRVACAGTGEAELQPTLLSCSETGPRGEGPIPHAFHTGTPAFSNDIGSDTSFFAAGRPALERTRLSCAAFPLTRQGRTEGVFAVYADRTGYFTDAEMALLQALAENISFAAEAHREEERRRQAEAALRQSEANMAVAQRIGHFASWEMDLVDETDTSTNPLRWSEEMFRIAGIEPGSVPVTNALFFSLVHPDDRPPIHSAVATAIRDRKQYSIVHRLIRPNGEERVLHETAQILTDPATVRPLKLVGTTHDITEQRRAEQALRQSETRLATIFRVSPAAISINTVQDGRFIEINDRYCELTGYSREELLGQTVIGLKLWANPEDRPPVMARLLNEGSIRNLETRYRTKSGEIRDVLLSLELIELPNPSEQALIGLLTDITERKRLEQQFLRAQRMESLGTLAGGIAHDLNNVLAPIMMGITLLREDLPSDQRDRLLDTLEQNVQRGADMIKQVLSFARGIEGQRLAVNLRHLLQEIRRIGEDTFPKSVTFDTHVAPDCWSILGDPGQLHQLLLNLCVNARDAMPQGGTLTLRAENSLIDEYYAAMNPDARPGPYVALQVLDTGTGIPSNVLDKIFEPFFTTKEIGKGTGLGLSTVLTIVRSHRGFINVHTEPGRSTAFHVYLPAATTPEGEPIPDPRAEPFPRGNGECILVVDDEDPVRTVTRKVLERYGYRVRTAADGAEAVAIYAEHQDEIQAVLADMMMPIMDGPATVRALKRINPAVKLIGASGLASDYNSARAATMGVPFFLSKPYTSEALLKTLHRALHDPGSTRAHP